MAKSYLLIQTASLGDVILATALAEEVHRLHPDANIDLLIKKGYENLFIGHPFFREILVWDKKHSKYKNLIRLIRFIRKQKYSIIYNMHRFASSGIICIFSKASFTIGFKKNPLSRFFSKSVKHEFNGRHEVQRNADLLLESDQNNRILKPVLYPGKSDFEAIRAYTSKPYCVLAPASLWATKELPESKWISLANQIPNEYECIFIGAANDSAMVARIIGGLNRSSINLCGKLSLLESVALMSQAKMNYTNDSAPMHMASSVNAPVTAFFCSTVPEFGFGPLSTYSVIAQTNEILKCRPCGIHGHRQCPENDFRCGLSIDTSKFVNFNV